MSDWPQGWTDDEQPRGDRYGRGSGSASPESARVMPHVRRPGSGAPQGPPQPRGGGHDAYREGYNEGQIYRGSGQAPPPRRPGPPPPGRGPYDGDDGPRPPKRWGRRIGYSVLALVLALVVIATGTYFWANSNLNREVDLASVEDRPESGKGTNYLIVGSDSREGLSDEQKQDLSTGSAEGKRADTMILLHVGDNGSTMVSLPRDSWVTIPEFTGSVSGNRIPAQQQKLNAAFAIEGPELLVRTVEYNTGVHIDHYVEIGFGGFANVVDALGGVEMCFDQAIKDEKSGADFAEGCHTLNGSESLAFNRQRYQEAEGDLGRTKNQQKFLGAISSQAGSPATVLNPFRLYPTLGATTDALIVDQDLSLWGLGQMFLAMRGAHQMNIPVANPGYATDKGSAVLWDMEQTELLMSQIINDEQVTIGVKD
ncbi:LCP family protein [Streptomyces carpaticus]|uniref:LCP family protein n=1 Tax=Streptomyces carpaticus TaxID=285558 RepID=A0ABV4ZLA8_9ACTN